MVCRGQIFGEGDHRPLLISLHRLQLLADGEDVAVVLVAVEDFIHGLPHDVDAQAVKWTVSADKIINELAVPSRKCRTNFEANL